MLGRKRNWPMNTPYMNYTASYATQPVNLNGYDYRVIPQPSMQTPYNGYWNGMPMNHGNQYPGYYQPNAAGQMNSGYYGGMQNAYGQKQNVSQLLFENPLQPQNEAPYGGYYQPEMPYQNMNPYPQQAFLPKQPGGFQSIMKSFKSQDGHLDLNKMVDTAGQMMNAVTQVSSMVKGLGGMIKA